MKTTAAMWVQYESPGVVVLQGKVSVTALLLFVT